MSDVNIDLLRRNECQPLTQEQIEDIKSQFHPADTANVNIVPYHIYDTDEHVVGEWRQTVDGVKKKKPVYERTITGLNVAMSISDWTDNIYSLGDTVNRILECRLFTNDNGILSYPLEARVLNHKLSVQFRAGGSRTLNSFIIRYIKTSDTWENVV